MEFKGFPRRNGVGVRNYVAVACTVGCSGDVVQKIAQLNPNVKPLVHHQGCAQTPPDIIQVEKVLVNLGLNPNVHSILLVSLGCESVSAQKVADRISREKTVELVTVQEKGMSAAVSRGLELVKKMVAEAEKDRRESFDVSELKLAIKCGASDTTSGIVSNPVTGDVADRLIGLGGTVIFGETTELIGAEHIIARRAFNEDVARRLYSAVKDIERRAMSMGVDMRGGQPTGGNIKGGITTIEEKSLGAICKTGSSQLTDVVDYGERIQKKGLIFMDMPGRELEALTGFAAGGAQVILFTTGICAPQGFPIVPVVKVSGNPEVCRRLSEHIDYGLSAVLYGRQNIGKAAKGLLEKVIRVASGELTKAEIAGYENNFDIYVRGPVI
ncbi:MAG: UxaA family hydrolase [Nitrososphaeria archaeon]